MQLAAEVFFAFFASLSFGVVFQLRRAKLVQAAFGGALGWLVYGGCSRLLTGDIVCYFLATLALSLYAEVMARRCRTPATVYLIVALIPLVPGGGLFETMESFIQGNNETAIEQGLHTLGIAGALAIGIVMVSSTMRIYAQRAFRKWLRRTGRLSENRKE